MDQAREQIAKTLNKISEKKNLVYIMQCSKRCPGCKQPIQRVSGCCKMHCGNCHVSFCWACLAICDPKDPYGHFNEPGAKCSLFASDAEIGTIQSDVEFEHRDQETERTLLADALDECAECPQCVSVFERMNRVNLMDCVRCKIYFCFNCGVNLG